MAAGGPGDHPISDILDYRLPVYGDECDGLIIELSKLMSREELWNTLDWFDKAHHDNPSTFAAALRKMLENLKQDRKQRGWEV